MKNLSLLLGESASQVMFVIKCPNTMAVSILAACTAAVTHRGPASVTVMWDKADASSLERMMCVGVSVCKHAHKYVWKILCMDV